MEIGKHDVKVLGVVVEESARGALMCNITVKFDNGETGIGRICMASADGTVQEWSMADIRKIFGWNDDSLETLVATNCEGIIVTAEVVEEEYKGRAVLKIARVWPIKKAVDPDAAKKLSAKYGNLLKCGATTVAVKPLSAVAPAVTPVAAPAVTKEKKADPGAATIAKFNEVFADRTQEVRNLLWNSLLNGVIPGVDTATANRDQWLAVYNAIPALRKQVEEQDKAQDEVPF